MASATPVERSIDTVRTFTQAVFNDREYEKLPDLQAEDYVQHGPMMGTELHGHQESLESIKRFHAAFSDLEAEEELVFSDGEYVCAVYTYRGTHDGEFMGIPPTDVAGEVSGTVVNRMADGKVAEAWVVVDFLGLMQQLGVVPAPDEPAA